MAIAKVVYKESSTATPSTWMDVTQKTVTSATMLSSITALKNDGTDITGTIATKSVGNLWFSSSTATFGVPTGYYSGTGAIYWTIASKGAETFVPAETAQTISSYQWLTGSQTIAAISSTYIGTGVPTMASATIMPSTSSQIAVSSGYYTTGSVTVGAISLQSKSVTPTESVQTITPDTNSSSAVPTGATMLSSNPMVTTIDLSFLEYGNTYHVTGGFYCTNNYRESDCRVNFDTVWTASENGEIEFTLESGTSDDPSRITLSKTQLKIYYPDGTTIIRGAIGSAMSEYNTLTFTDLSDSYIGLSSVTVGAISSTYVGTGVNTQASSNYYTVESTTRYIPSATYLTGRQTIYGVQVRNLEASYIASGVKVTVGDTNNLSRIANVTGTLQGAESFAAIYKSLAYRSTIYSSHPLVSEWANSLSTVLSSQFAGQNFYGDMTFGNVQSIGNYGFGFPYGNTVTINGEANIYLPNCTSFGVGAFAANLNVKYIEAPLISDIKEHTFASARITSASFNNCTNISPYAFIDCRSLSGSLYFPNVENIGSSAFASCDIRIADFPKCATIQGAAFYSCRYLTTAIFPSCTYIHYQAFSNCSNLTTISFPKCEYISYYAFYACSALSEAIFPECSVISGTAFSSCKKLKKIDFPKCKIITNSAFYGCSTLESAIFPKCEYIYYSAFAGCSSLSVASFPLCSYVERGAFYGCTTLANINLETCEYISSGAFNGCYSLASIDLPSCKTIGGGVFSWCSNISSISLPVCETIYSYAFASCPQLCEISLPSLTSMQGMVFTSCVNLESVYFMGSSVPTFSANVFYATPIAQSTFIGRFGSIYVPSSLVDSYKTATNFTVYSSRIVGI